MKNQNKCLNCEDPDIHFENKFCCIECADLYDGIEVPLHEQRINLK